MRPNSKPFKECLGQLRQVTFPLRGWGGGGVSPVSASLKPGEGAGVYEAYLLNTC